MPKPEHKTKTESLCENGGLVLKTGVNMIRVTDTKGKPVKCLES